jgi:hypothetical protein
MTLQQATQEIRTRKTYGIDAALSILVGDTLGLKPFYIKGAKKILAGIGVPKYMEPRILHEAKRIRLKVQGKSMEKEFCRKYKEQSMYYRIKN